MLRNLVLVLVLVSLTACGRSGKRNAIQNKGSDTLVNVAQAWAEAYREVNSEIRVAVSGGGSGVGIAALLNGEVDLASSSREMKDKEIELAKSKGITPKKWIVGYDALAVFIHKDNPKENYTLKELADIYGEEGPVNDWGDMAVTVPGCGSGKIVRVSRQNNSGTYACFKDVVLGKGRDYKLGSNDLHGSKDVVDLVENTPCAIGYSGLAYATDHVKMAGVAKEAGKAYVKPTVKAALDGSYPIARPLLMYTNGEPTGAVKAYLDWILSDDGQRIIMNKGYAPIRPLDDE